MRTSALKGSTGRFYNFFDGVVRSLTVRPASNGDLGECSIEIAVRDSHASEHSNEGWVIVQIFVRGIKEFRFTNSPRAYNQVLTNGLALLDVEGVVYLVLNPDNEIASASQAQKEEFYVCGSDPYYMVKPYRPSGTEEGKGNITDLR